VCTALLLFCLVAATALNSYAGVAGKGGGLNAGSMLKSNGPNTAIANNKAAGALNKTKSFAGNGLSSLTISSGTLSPVFATGTTSYSATVANSVSSITVIRQSGPLTISATAAATNITSNSATLGYTLSDDGGEVVVEQGVIYGTSPNPTLGDGGDHVFFLGNDVGTFSGTVTGLTSKTTYYVRGFAENESGGSYGPQITFTTPDQAPVVTATAAAINYYGGFPAVSIASAVTITDADDTYLQSVTVLGANSLFGDILSVPVTGNLSGSFSGSTLTISGNGTAAQYQAALNALTFQTNGSQFGSRTISVSASDGILSTPYVTVANINVIAPPTLTTAAATSIGQYSAVVGYTITNPANLSISDQGIVYSHQNTTPTLADTKVTSFSSPITISNVFYPLTY